MGRFTDYLETKVDDIEPPKLLPIGNYSAQVTKAPDFEDIKGKDGTIYEKCTFNCKILDAIEVDEDELADFGRPNGVPFRVDFLINTDPAEENSAKATLNRVKTFLETLGCIEDGMSLQQGFAGAASTTFGVTMGHRPTDDGRVFLQTERTFVLD